MSYEALRSVLDIVEDPHAFVTAYASYVDTHKLPVGQRPDVAEAAHNFVRFGTVD